MLNKTSPFADALPEKQSARIQSPSEEFLSRNVFRDMESKNLEDTAGINESASSSDRKTGGVSNLAKSEDIHKHTQNVEKSARKTRVVCLLLIIVGAVISVIFLELGIKQARLAESDSFEIHANTTAKEIEHTMAEYERLALWIHQACRDWRTTNFTRRDFEVLYNYLIAGGVDVYAAEWVPNITHEERPVIEAEGEISWGAVEGVDYQGFTGQEPDPNNPNNPVVMQRSVQPFYYPIHFGEPTENVASVGHLDLFSLPVDRLSIFMALDTWTPILTPRFHPFQNTTEEDGYFVSLYHPGVGLPEKFQASPRDLANVVISVRSVLTHAARDQTDKLLLYLYDTTSASIDSDRAPEFLGGVQFDNEMNELIHLNATEFAGLAETYMYFQRTLDVGGRKWTVVAVPKQGEYKPDIISIILGGGLIFVGAVALSMWLHHNMERTNEMNQVITKAAAEAAILASMFPAKVRERMIQDALAKQMGVYEDGKYHTQKNPLVQGGMDGSSEGLLTNESVFGTKPIAELYPYTTIMFCDLVGFTAWSSVREPSQVFQLLETIYHAFDTIAKKRGVFKVETVGDCYVAIAGLPTPRKDHAKVMARFATNCRDTMHKICRALETKLGPDTGELACRIGLHSGQVVGGVLRGENARFQLFGDTMNMASRMESTGVRNRIQVSKETADLLKQAGRGRWLVRRETPVHVKGKGTVLTYWLQIVVESKSSSTSNSDVLDELGITEWTQQQRISLNDEKTERLVAWNVEVLSSLLRKIVARRMTGTNKRHRNFPGVTAKPTERAEMVLDEVKEIISLPSFNGAVVRKRVDPTTILLDTKVMKQLESLVSEIAAKYRDNSFHNFEHASHVTMSVIKMLARMVDPTEIATTKGRGGPDDKLQQAELHDDLQDSTFGIASEPLTQFACAFSALIHDLDHPGVSNMTLIQEASPLAAKYKNKSVAEQNSVDMAWSLLMKPDYDDLRACICSNDEDFAVFRSLIVNAVMATDIMDRDLGAARKARWAKAFDGDGDNDDDIQTAINRKATIVIEHLIQASDVSHTMQHWHVYVKWNEKLFQEMYKAYKDGRLDTDPSLNWYKGELGFFDFYIIPLAKKLFACGVFGVSSDEFLNYAITNREEWERKGAAMVAQYVKNYEEKRGQSQKIQNTSFLTADDMSSDGITIEVTRQQDETSFGR